jgi:arsenate reductase
MIVIHHNPACGTSRNVLKMIEASGETPVVVEYLKTGLTPRAALREKGSPAAELGLLAEGVADEAILDAMVAHPVLVNRPIVCSPKGVRLCRPSEAVLDLLARIPAGFTKEDGEKVTDAAGERAR